MDASLADQPPPLCQLPPSPKASAQMVPFGKQTSGAPPPHWLTKGKGKVMLPKAKVQPKGSVGAVPESVPPSERAAKRRNVVCAHKRRPSYLAFAKARPINLRDPDEPMTPDTEESMPKREWETRMQKWRKGIRDWNAEKIDGDDQDYDCVIG